jgi:hypothetical protein
MNRTTLALLTLAGLGAGIASIELGLLASQMLAAFAVTGTALFLDH